MWDQIVILVATGLTFLLGACHFPPSAKVGPFSRWAPVNTMKGLLITHTGDFLPPACCCAKQDPSPPLHHQHVSPANPAHNQKIPSCWSLLHDLNEISCVVCVVVFSSSSRKQQKHLRRNSWGKHVAPWPHTYTPNSSTLHSTPPSQSWILITLQAWH